jgi:hypothetical protein
MLPAGVILVIGPGSMNPVVCVSGDEQIFGAAFGDALLQQVTPRVIPVAVAPVFGHAVNCGRAQFVPALSAEASRFSA